jgi:hypothetical protein
MYLNMNFGEHKKIIIAVVVIAIILFIFALIAIGGYLVFKVILPTSVPDELADMVDDINSKL